MAVFELLAALTRARLISANLHDALSIKWPVSRFWFSPVRTL